MPYDPNLPQENTLADAVQMRAQFAGLKDIIDALAAGNVTAVVVDGVTTVAPGQPAAVGVNVIGNTLHLTFAIPRGNDGAQGPPFAQAIVDGVATLPPGSDATVSVNFDGANVRFIFGIPRGADGVPGEVTNAAMNAALATAIAGTSANTNGVGILGMAVSPTYDASQVQNIASKLDELINALRR